ncbi:PIG-L deacetylase family protein [Pseudonocardia nematodicida]|uniref:PIG-L deacetylase family protein n=1 Tax=Pseudonocardia nematodicida TaxID=1206997 RepID=A0ABV1K4S2_9PSEU
MVATARLVVVSAHAADFVWRSGGAIARCAADGGEVTVLCLTFGERGESAALWKSEGATLESVKAAREDGSRTAAETLGARIEFFDAGDYPLRETPELLDALVARFRALRPTLLLTHSARDPYNLDHALTHEMVLRARMVAQADGLPDRSTPPLGATQVMAFEPHQPEQCGFVPDNLLDITPVMDRKRIAMKAMDGAQGHLVDYYAELAVRRGVQARRNGAPSSVTHAEAFQQVFPTVADRLW